MVSKFHFGRHSPNTGWRSFQAEATVEDLKALPGLNTPQGQAQFGVCVDQFWQSSGGAMEDVSYMLKELGNQGEWHKALALFHWLADKQEVRDSSFYTPLPLLQITVYVAVPVLVLILCSGVGSVPVLVQFRVWFEFKFKSWSWFWFLVYSFLSFFIPRCCVQLLGSAKIGSAAECGRIASATISLLGRHGQVDAARNVFGRAKGSGMGSNVFTYSALLSAYGNIYPLLHKKRKGHLVADGGLCPDFFLMSFQVEAAEGGRRWNCFGG